jgi:hypothetical protein
VFEKKGSEKKTGRIRVPPCYYLWFTLYNCCHLIGSRSRQCPTTNVANSLSWWSLAVIVTPCSWNGSNTIANIVNSGGILPAVATVLGVYCTTRAVAACLGLVEDLDDLLALGVGKRIELYGLTA